MTDSVYHNHPCFPISDPLVSMVVDLTPFGMTGRVEHLSVVASPHGNYVVACLPFFTYGIAYGDLVAIHGPDFTFDRVLQSANLRTLRLAIADPDRIEQVHEPLHRSIINSELPHEWHGSGYVSILIRHRKDQDHLLACVGSFIENEYVTWEIDPEWS